MVHRIRRDQIIEGIEVAAVDGLAECLLRGDVLRHAHQNPSEKGAESTVQPDLSLDQWMILGLALC